MAGYFNQLKKEKKKYSKNFFFFGKMGGKFQEKFTSTVRPDFELPADAPS